MAGGPREAGAGGGRWGCPGWVARHLLVHVRRAESGEKGALWKQVRVSLEMHWRDGPSRTFHSLLHQPEEAARGPNGQAGLGSQADATPEGCL